MTCRGSNLDPKRKLLAHFINSNIPILHISNENQFSPYDFIIKNNNGLSYIIELKSRLGNINKHSHELLSISKIEKYKKICKKKIKCVFIFNHIDTFNSNKNEYYYFEVDFGKLDEIGFKLDTTYQLSIKYIKPIEECISFFKK